MVKLPPLSPAVLLLLLVLLVYYSYEVGVEGSGFRCATDGTCKALVGYTPAKATTIEEVISLFQIASRAELLEQNSLASTTPQTFAFPATWTVRIPIICRCEYGTGNCDRISPYYIAKEGDTLDHIANSVFAHLVDVDSLALFGHVADRNKINPGTAFWIPLPCSCDRVGGAEVTHYALVVREGDTLNSIAADYSTTVARLEKLNNLNSTTSLVAGQVIGVPLRYFPPPAFLPHLPHFLPHLPQAENAESSSGSSPTSGGRKGFQGSVLITVTVAISAAILLAAAGACYFGTCKNKRTGARKQGDAALGILLGAARNERGGPEVTFYRLRDITAATNNFCESNNLGRGGFGAVYRGVLRGGQEVAIKRLSRGSKQGLEEFTNEVMLIAKFQHTNLVQLLGFCTEGEEQILIYEYMPNKSLDYFLFDPILSKQLDWERRFEIVMGVARGLQYLHRESRLKVIHRDLKAGNILLDAAMNPKISDFGLARIFGDEQTHISTNKVAGTW